jgi:hypothetical protein
MQRSADVGATTLEQSAQPRLMERLDRARTLQPGAPLRLEALGPRRMGRQVAKRYPGRDLREQPHACALRKRDGSRREQGARLDPRAVLDFDTGDHAQHGTRRSVGFMRDAEHVTFDTREPRRSGWQRLRRRLRRSAGHQCSQDQPQHRRPRASARIAEEPV